MNINELTNNELGQRALETRSSERILEVDFLRCLSEIKKRDLHLEWGYPSLFNYLVKYLGYSEGSAVRRIRVSALIEKYPMVAEMLKEGNTNLTSLSAVSGILNPENIEVILSQIRGITSREVEEIVARYKPPAKRAADSLKAVVSKRDEVREEKASPSFFDSEPMAKSEESKNADIPSNSFCNRQEGPAEFREAPQEEAPVEYQLKCFISSDVKIKLERAQALMAHKLNGDVRLDNVLDVLLDTYLNKNGREEKSERLRDKKTDVGEEKTPSDPTTKRTHIPNKVKRAVFERDGSACSYTSSDGTCCKKTSGLELDHLIPVAFGGDNSEENLRVLCREHNQFMARQMFGREFIEEKISDKVKV